jgi:hypothetical protein
MLPLRKLRLPAAAEEVVRLGSLVNEKGFIPEEYAVGEVACELKANINGCY